MQEHGRLVVFPVERKESEKVLGSMKGGRVGRWLLAFLPHCTLHASPPALGPPPAWWVEAAPTYRLPWVISRFSLPSNVPTRSCEAGFWVTKVTSMRLHLSLFQNSELNWRKQRKTLDNSVQFRYSVMSDSLWPHGLQHTRLPCPSKTPGACSNSCPSCRWCHYPLSPSFAFNLSQH